MKNSLMKKRNELKNQKGFTLVEVIVVLVILAILAAILIPTFVGYIDKANEKSAIVEGRSALLAAQTIASEAYAEKADTATITTKDVKDLAELDGTLTGTDADTLSITAGVVDDFTYNDGKYTVTYKASTKALTAAKNS